MRSQEEVTVLGFDVRKHPTLTSNWPEDRRLRFLLCPGVLRPLSVDRVVWESVAMLSRSDNPLGLLNSINEALEQFPEILGMEATSPILIEVAVVADLRSLPYWREVFAGYIESQRLPEGVLAESLGFDVADRYLLSGMSNCGFSELELNALREEWIQCVNSVGLFDSVDDAERFSGACNSLIPEHAPFSPFRLRRIRFEIVA